ncbi:similar to Saccharomyces cerevisiae YGR099W TEL2 Essential DNA-binding protein specific to single-stranded yeast telomeric DNA repeats [Maudiozyma saulgeensis]|uniref:Similar to Saccharomyces cerevisiae YGR099W TEL2 Essential DNA-binding protein specific to single-stranded yeast telomeric DNA repeats n=1 Tax=Maudiozyma saulgeensis TaxID=1789683 RepID=A0A1X7QXQ8_9SACH|nr:similar to Saccharomyces cerevisiae YGR099W TEL2 Essential DNA-binding protein specific to single-stranded yeast telomeric DNA repeats [Kazachstania saulgeensis]
MSNMPNIEQGSKESDIVESLTVLKARNGPITDLDEIMNVIQNIIPLYLSLKLDTLRLLFCIISKSPLILAQLVTYTNSIDQGQQTSHDKKSSKLYKDFTFRMLFSQSDCLYNNLMVAKKNRVEGQFIKSLFFGSRLFNMLSTHYNILQYLEVMNIQWKYLCGNNINETINESLFPYISDLMLAELSLHPVFATDSLFDKLFLAYDECYKYFLKIFLVRSNRFNSKRMIIKYLIPYLESLSNKQNYQTIYLILSNLSAFKYFDTISLINIKSASLQEIIVRNLPSVTGYSIFMNLASKFGKIDEQIDNQIAVLLVMLLTFSINNDQKATISHNSEFLSIVTTRLGHMNYEVRERTMYIAKLVSNNELKYDSNYQITIPNLQFNMDPSLPVNLKLLRSEAKPTELITRDLILGMDKLTVNYDSLIENSTDSDDDDELETEIKDIVFLKDLMEAYINIGRGQSANQIPLLKRTTQLVRQKRFLPLEVNYYSTQLLSSITSINNTREEDNFEPWRINALVSILVVVPEQIQNLFKILFNSELSIQQRISLLTSIALSARELRGIDDDQVHKPEYDFPTARLPWDELQTKENLIEDIPRPGIINPSGLSEGATVWKSQKLNLKSNKNSETENRFRKMAPLFFYPLVHGWKNGIDLGSFDQLFKSHYISTMRIVHNCAYPVHDYEMMTEELEQILTEAQSQGIPILEE